MRWIKSRVNGSGRLQFCMAAPLTQSCQTLRVGRKTDFSTLFHFSPRQESARMVRSTSEVRRHLMGNTAPRLQGLRHLALRVRDLGKAKEFYVKAFGMKVVWEPDPQNCYLSSGLDNLAL